MSKKSNSRRKGFQEKGFPGERVSRNSQRVNVGRNGSLACEAIAGK